MNIKDLQNALGGGAKTNKFKVIINAPMLSAITNLANNFLGGPTSNPDSNTLSILAKNTTIPAKTIGQVDIWHRGRKYPIRGKAAFEHRWDITFYNDAKMNVRRFFEEWMYEIDRYDSILTESLYTNNYLGTNSINIGYMTNLRVQQLCSENKISADYEIVHAFPIGISSQPLDSSSNNRISEFTVTFSYDYWIPYETNGIAGVINKLNV